MDNKVLQHYRISWLVQETEISQWKEQDFSLEIDFQFTRMKHCIGIGAWIN